MEDTWPDKREEAASEVADEAHQKRKVWNKDSKQDCDKDTRHTEATSPNLEFSVLRPN